MPAIVVITPTIVGDRGGKRGKGRARGEDEEGGEEGEGDVRVLITGVYRRKVI